MVLSYNLSVVVCAALLCVGCDIPAARKVCGFVGHQALIKGLLKMSSLQGHLGKRVTTQISILLVGHHAQMYPTERLQTATYSVIFIPKSISWNVSMVFATQCFWSSRTLMLP